MADPFFEQSGNPIAVWDDAGNYATYSTEAIVAKKMNRFDGWWCTAGQNQLFVDFDGQIYRGICGVGGRYGNVFTAAEFPEGGILCNKEVCMCGGDIMAPKFKNRAGEATYLRDLKLAEFPIEQPTVVTGAEVLREGRPLRRVAWSLGRRCNYDCSYCSPLVHSAKEALKAPEALMKAARLLNGQFCRGQKTEFFIAGGEPTIQPGIVELVRYFHEQGHQSVLISNGSGQTKMYRQLIEHSHLCLSAHFQFVRETHFLENICAVVEILETRRLLGRPLYHRVDVKLLTMPGQFERSRALARQVLSIPGFSKHGAVRFNPIFRPEQNDRLYDYPDAELGYFGLYNDEGKQSGLFSRSRREQFMLALRGEDVILKSRLRLLSRFVWTDFVTSGGRIVRLEYPRKRFMQWIHASPTRRKVYYAKPRDWLVEFVLKSALLKMLVYARPRDWFVELSLMSPVLKKLCYSKPRDLWIEFLHSHAILKKLYYFSRYVSENWRGIGRKLLGRGN